MAACDVPLDPEQLSLPHGSPQPGLPADPGKINKRCRHHGALPGLSGFCPKTAISSLLGQVPSHAGTPCVALPAPARAPPVA